VRSRILAVTFLANLTSSTPPLLVHVSLSSIVRLWFALVHQIPEI
jgi:hypothetical protein